jgi:hypothetical protein
MTPRRVRVVALDLPTFPDDGDYHRRTSLLAKSITSMALGSRWKNKTPTARFCRVGSGMKH